jgi:inner membrane protein
VASIGHVAVGLAAARGFHLAGGTWGKRLSAMALWSALALLPDADAIGFSMGVRYADEWGHRGATHSLMFALGIGLLGAACAPLFGASRPRALIFVTAVVASHPLLDSMTTGGLGCALLWPFDLERYFAPLRFIPVAPIGGAFFSARGLAVATVEVVLFFPFLLYAFWPRRADELASR